jgi:hypothetical protein
MKENFIIDDLNALADEFQIQCYWWQSPNRNSCDINTDEN